MGPPASGNSSGETVGVGVVPLAGLGDGDGLGFGVGEGLGDGVGLGDGPGVGEGDGEGLGLGVGEGVGVAASVMVTLPGELCCKTFSPPLAYTPVLGPKEIELVPTSLASKRIEARLPLPD